MKSLYEIEKEIQIILDIEPDENGEINIDYDALDQLEMDRVKKVENLIKYYKDTLRRVEAFKAEEKELAARRKVLENKRESLKTYLDIIHKGEKAEYGVHKISYRKSEAVSDGPANILPDYFLSFSDPKPKKAELKKLLKSGLWVPEFELVESKTIQIK